VLCGRKQLDGYGGNNHAMEYYEKRKYPLAVKLGKINAAGADVYSYDEDDMVEDANLIVHLAHFGINMSRIQKTAKTMAELEIYLNQKVGEWDRIQESGSQLAPLYEPGFTGMQNLGSSCYMNSVMQVLFTIPDFAHKYASDVNRGEYLQQRVALDSSSDFIFQMSKLANGLLSGQKSAKPLDDTIKSGRGIKPNSFKLLVEKGYLESGTKRQQDAHEFLMHLLKLCQQNSRTDLVRSTVSPVDSVKFRIEKRIQCGQSNCVKYTNRDEICLSLPISRYFDVNKEQVSWIGIFLRLRTIVMTSFFKPFWSNVTPV
jgi:ubiquitin carboxyl-terminal hydrolase 5/13